MSTLLDQLGSVSASTVHYTSHSTSPLVSSSAFTLSSPLAPFTTSPLTSYLPSLTFALFSGPPSTTPLPSFLLDTTQRHLTRSSFSSRQTLSQLNVTSLFSLVASTARVSTGSIRLATAAASTSLENQTEETTVVESSLFDSLDASLYLSVNRGILVAIILGAISIFTIVGNLMVIWAIFNYRPLHNVQNMFLVSLAVADIAVAVLVMPFNVAYNLLGKWIFGLHLCEMWLTSDVLCCTASILNLCAIALDRYWAIHDPINYAQKRTMNRVCTSIGIVWILSAFISIPPLIGWNDWPEEFNEETPCKLSEEKSYLIYSSSGSFYIPLLIMTVVYFKIFKATRRRLKDRAKASAMANLGHSATVTTVSTPVIAANHNITKSSSNEDSSSSGSPKASHSFTHIKSRCVRCCNGSRAKSNEKDAIDKKGKNKFSRKHKNSVKEARIEIESASDDMEHSRNDISSSDAYGLTSGAVSGQADLCNALNGQQANAQSKLTSTNGLAAGTSLSVSDGLVQGGTHSSQATCAIVSSPAVSFANHPTVHSSASLSSDCCQPKQATSQFESHLNGAFCSVSTSVPVGGQFAYVCSKSPLTNEPIIYIDGNDNENMQVKTFSLKQDTNDSIYRRTSYLPATTQEKDGISLEHDSGQKQLNVYEEFSNGQRSAIDTIQEQAQVSSVASVTNMHKPELSSSTAAITTTISQVHSGKTVQLPAQSQVSVKKIWEEKQKISLSRERRATRILGIVMGVFVACWLPFFLMYVIMPFCDSCYLSREMESFITWLGYINSALNPLIYCGFNRDFRRAFQKILSCKRV